MDGGTYSAACESWERVLRCAQPYWGSQVSVSLEEKALDKHDMHGFVQIALSVGNYRRNVMGSVRADEFRNYDPKVVEQIKHQTALRLESLAQVCIVDFSSALLECQKTPVDKKLIRSLKSSELPDKIDLLHDPWLRQMLLNVQGLAPYQSPSA